MTHYNRGRGVWEYYCCNHHCNEAPTVQKPAIYHALPKEDFKERESRLELAEKLLDAYLELDQFPIDWLEQYVNDKAGRDATQ